MNFIITETTKYQSELLRKCAEYNLEYREALIQKAKIIEKKQSQLSDREEFEKILNSIDLILNQIENHLELHSMFFILK